MMCSPIEPEEESGASGISYGEFGPIELDPSARQTLETVLGQGGSEFPVTVLMKPDAIDEQGNDEFEEIDGKVYVNSHVVKICFQDIEAIANVKKGSRAGASKDEVLSLKYTIDHPRVTLHPFDTRKFRLSFTDHKQDISKDFHRSIELRAHSREQRDTIALLIKCFSAQTYFVNSRIIAGIADDDIADCDESQATIQQFDVSEVLIELEFIKKELYSQISQCQSLEKEKHSLCN